MDVGGYSVDRRNGQGSVRVAWRDLTSQQQREVARRAWRSGVSCTGTRAEAYLRTLGVVGYLPKSLRYAPSMVCPALQNRFPALMARVVDPCHRDVLEAVQPIFLDPHGVGTLSAHRPLIGDSARGVVCIGSFNEGAIVVAKRLPDALAAGAALGLPCIATLSHFRMSVLELPAEISKVTIAQRPSGRADAEFDLRDKLEAAGVEVSMVSPPDGARTWAYAARARL